MGSNGAVSVGIEKTPCARACSKFLKEFRISEDLFFWHKGRELLFRIRRLLFFNISDHLSRDKISIWTYIYHVDGGGEGVTPIPVL